jgi:hypothetical protein
MKNISFTTTRIPFVIVLAALAILFTLLLETCQPNLQNAEIDKSALLNAEKDIIQLDKSYQDANTVLKSESDSLQEMLSKTQDNLLAVKKSLKQTQRSLVSLAQKDTAGRAILEQLSDCDSLKQKVLEYSVKVDSASTEYECTISQLEDLVAIKEAELLVCRSSYLSMKRFADVNLLRERRLTEDLQTAYKVQRRKVNQNKLLAGGMLILSGITTTLYINANK